MKNPQSTEAYIQNHPEWRDGLLKLRTILLSNELEESIKWGVPAYTYRGKNVIGLAAFKSYFGLWFHDGALLKDEAQVLVNAQDGNTVSMRQWRFTKPSEIKVRILKAYIAECVDNLDAGRRIKRRKPKALKIEGILRATLISDKKLQSDFDNFGRRRSQ